MKKLLLFCCLSLIFSFCYSEIPENLAGLWEGKDRYVFFETDSEQNSTIAVYLKDYYGWYVDRVSEPVSYREKQPVSRNSATSRNNILIKPSVGIILSENDSSAFELHLEYSPKDTAVVPLCIINDAMYKEFWVTSGDGFFRGNAERNGISVSEKPESENLYSWFRDMDTNAIYKLRYWKTSMEYDPELKAVIKKGEKETEIPKQITSAGKVYTCVPGRRVYVRNLKEKDALFDGNAVIQNENGTIVALDDVYLKKILDKNSFEDLMELVREMNSRRKPDPAPLFPPEELDYHWEMIDYLEKGNKIIENVRERQKDFGPRGREYGR